MSGDINIGIAGDASKFIRETGNVEDALQDVSDSLDDMARDTKSSARDAEKAVEKLEDSFDDARKKAKDLGNAGDQAGSDVKKGMKQASDGVDDFKGEANSTAKESAASFDGSAESIVGSFQEIAANAFEGFGPAGAVAGLAAAAGIGLATAEFQRQQEEIEQLKDRLSGLYQGALESGRDYIDQSQFIAESNDLRFNSDRADEWQRLQKDSLRLGIEENTIIKANSGDLDAQGEVLRRIADLKSDTSGDAYYVTERDGLLRLKPEYADMETRWDTIKGVTEAYAETTKAARKATSDFLMEAIDNASEATIQVDELGNKLVQLPNDQQVFIDAKTGQASQAVDGFKGKLDEIEPTKAVIVNGTVSLDKSAITNYKPPTLFFPGKVVDRFGKVMF